VCLVLSSTARSFQEYHSKFTQLLEFELKENTDAIKQRLSMNRVELQRLGLALFDLVGSQSGMLFGNYLIRLTHAANAKNTNEDTRIELPHHNFRPNDLVLLSNLKDEGFVEGIVSERAKWYIVVIVNDLPRDLTNQRWRVDRSGNRIAHDRCMEALRLFTDPQGPQYCPLR
jgi:hypothetical protein